jgi:hypothetical protein
MPEPQNPAASEATSAQVVTEGAGAAAPAAGDQDTVNKDGGEGSGSASEKKEETPQGDNQGEPEVRQRKTAKDFIIERQQRKIEKLKSKASGNDGGQGGNGGESDEEEEEDDEKGGQKQLVRELIQEEVLPTLTPVLEKHVQAEDDAEVQAFLAENPDFKPYEAQARRFMSHPSRRSLPIKSIFYEVAGDDLMRIGAERARKADEKARETQAGGGSARGEDTPTDVWSLSPEEFAKKREEIRRRGQ